MNKEEEDDDDVGTLVDPSSATIALILLISFCFTDLFSLCFDQQTKRQVTVDFVHIPYSKP